MLFNSFVFAVFLPLVFILYWSFFNRKSVKLRNLFLLVASYLFYGWWDWRFLSLIIISSLMDFLLAIKIDSINKQESNCTVEQQVTIKKQKRWYLFLSIVVNIGFLGFFKYFNFFTDSLASLLSIFGITLSSSTAGIILPVGISFYTFQTLSYTIDIYNKKTKLAENWVQFFTFVSFFPQLVAGPIERAKNLLPQFEQLTKPDYKIFRSAMLLIAWGFFKKIMIADRLAVFVDKVFSDIPSAEGLPVMLGIIFFTLQLYLDFSAYSNIAIGVARLFGFDLMKNFNRPYFSTSFANFWKRWHISLSSWFQDYLYIPLGGNRKGIFRTKLNILIVFAVSGLWHGASWNFVIWGILNGLFLIILDPFLFNTKNKTDNNLKTNKLVVNVFKAGFIFACWALSLTFFRAQGLDAAIDCFKYLSFSNASNIVHFGLNAVELKFTLILILILLLKGIICEKDENIISKRFFRLPFLFRWIFYIIFILSIIYFGQYGNGNENSFIYFQF
jgi:D-alanyl-lipoteichoic acid acyltransferase DltB (MBOAT superfamily)